MKNFSHWENVKFPKFSCLSQNYLKQLKCFTQLKLDNSNLLLHKVSIKNTDCLLICAKFSKSTHLFADFTKGMIGNGMGHLLKCVKLRIHFINFSKI